MRWILGLDMGSNSIGWWAFSLSGDADADLASYKSLDGGVCIFPDGRETPAKGRVGDSCAVKRRIARGMRRNRDHGKNRVKRLVATLIDLGLLPEDEDARARLFQTPPAKSGDPERYNPYRLRAEALERPLSPDELGRALFHLGLRRGFKSNRKEASDDDGGKLKEAINALDEKLGDRTLGQYMWERYQKERESKAHGPIRFKEGVTVYPSRHHYQKEFDRIRDVQQPHHNLLDDDWRRLAEESIFFQHPLRPVERGRCEYFPDQPRHWKDCPISHRFRIAQEINNLRVIDDRDFSSRPLTLAQRRAIREKLMTTQKVSFKTLRNLKDGDGNRLFPRDATFNLESDKRKDLKGHLFAIRMRKNPVLAQLYDRLEGTSRLDDIAEVLHQAETDDDVIEHLVGDFELLEAEAVALARMPLASGTVRLSRKAMSQLSDIMEDQGLEYYDAVREMTDDAGNPLHHSLRGDGQTYDRLPYYGRVMPNSMLGADPAADGQTEPEARYGRINNPTVHIALNQLRKLINTLTERFGSAPERINLEMTRDLKLSKKSREEINAEQAANERRNDKIRKALKDEHGIADPSALDIKKYKLWEELGKDLLDRRCPFSGQVISAAQLFNGEAEIEHILPFSRTLDDGLANLTVAKTWANRLKGNRTPFEAFESGAYAGEGCDWEGIAERAQSLPPNKSWRFGADAMARFEGENEFIARQLNDTSYMARVACRYLRALDGVKDVVPNRGRLTAMLRGKWGLNGILSDDNLKTREDHRHHAVDAAVVGLTTRGLLAKVSRASRRGTEDRLHIDVPPLPPELERTIRTRVPTILPHVKPDHGLKGKMFKETAYGFPKKGQSKSQVVTRKAITALSKKEAMEGIRDPDIRRQLADALYEGEANEVKHEKILADFGAEHGIKRVRILVENQTVQPVPSAPYKGYSPDSYVCCDIWRIPAHKGRKKTVWKGVFWAYADVRDGRIDAERGRPHPAAKHLMRLFKDDIVAVGPADRSEIFRVFGFSTTNNRLDVRSVVQANPDRIFESINMLGSRGLRRLHVTPDGRLFDPASGTRR